MANSERRMEVWPLGRKLTKLVCQHSKKFPDATPFAVRYSLFAADAALNLKVCDKACGSGHFLIAAAHRIGRRLAG